ncbi:hypothetical protein E3N88_09804 [Mikania micrantha]|uniref:Uncharacterized protein n=1 Tax=Mikania micrantha TaxID=192012 RepID=A0A5N6PKY7_9ASTR|nr:hypothetical protein E3N88_09804 [Mikania micrantha]
MVRSPCCSKIGLNRGSWTSSEDKILTDYIRLHGEGKWRHLPIKAGTYIHTYIHGDRKQLRWLNYLKPDIKRGNISPEEDDLIIRLHKLLGNRWSLIAGRLPGRTDNEIKNYWNTTLAKKAHHIINQVSHKQTLKNRKWSNVVRTKAVRWSATHISPHPQLLRPSVGEFKLDVAKATADAFLMYEEKSSLNVDVNMECLSDIFNMDNEVAKGDVMMSGSSTFTAAAGAAGDGSTQNDMLDSFSWMLGGEWLSSL